MTTVWTGNILAINVLGVGEVMFDAEAASAANRAQAERHGWTQRLADRAALPAPVRAAGMGDDAWRAMLAAHRAAKHAAIAELAEYYMSGDVAWKMSGSGEREGGLLLRALVVLKPNRTLEQIQTFLKSRTPAQLKEVRNDRAVVEQMNKLRLEAIGDQDTSGALAGLDDDEGDAEGDDSTDQE
jgi:hypothetical protein